MIEFDFKICYSCDGDATALKRADVIAASGTPGTNVNNKRVAVLRFPLFSWLNARDSPQYLHCSLQACYKDDCEPVFFLLT